MKKILTLAALVGVTGVGVAHAEPATLVGVNSYSKNGTTTWLIQSAGTWDVDTDTGVATLTGEMKIKAGLTPLGKGTYLFTHTMTGGTISSGAATGSSWSCTEGVFGGVVGADLCGNYSFENGTDDSTYTPTATGATVTIGGDDVVIGDPQTLANSYSDMTGSFGAFMGSLTVPGNYQLSNGVVGVGGYDFIFSIAVANPLPVIEDGEIETLVDTASAAFEPDITLGSGLATEHTLVVTDDGDHGSCVVTPGDATGTVVYTPVTGYTGGDTCVLTLTDSDADSDTATIDITVSEEEEEVEITLPGGSSSMDLWSLSLLGSLPLLMRRRRRS
jgi:hypothetical protein